MIRDYLWAVVCFFIDHDWRPWRWEVIDTFRAKDGAVLHRIEDTQRCERCNLRRVRAGFMVPDDYEVSRIQKLADKDGL